MRNSNLVFCVSLHPCNQHNILVRHNVHPLLIYRYLFCLPTIAAIAIVLMCES